MKNFTDITFLLDRSGSMQSMITDVIGGYANFVRDQQRFGDNASLTLIQFDNRYQRMFPPTIISQVNPVLGFIAGGSTALLDALGKSITETGQRLAEVDEANRPDKVIFVIMTDGEENASTEYTLDAIKTMIEHQRMVYKWEFLFMGANIDAFSVGGGMNIGVGSTVTYDATGQGTRRAFTAASTYTANLRSGIDANELSLSKIYTDTQ